MRLAYAFTRTSIHTHVHSASDTPDLLHTARSKEDTLLKAEVKILQHVHPLLSNDRETTRQQPLLGNGSTNRSIARQQISNIQQWRNWEDVFSMQAVR